MTGRRQKQKAGTPAILSIQSAVAYGHVGNSAATLPLQRLGFDVWPLNTVQLGHHPGYGDFAGHIVAPEQLAVIADGVLERAPLDDCVGLLSGYLGNAVVADLVIEMAEMIKAKRPDLVYLLDPVIGDDGPGVFVRDAVPGAIKDRLLPLANIVTPNGFELAYLTGKKIVGLEDVRTSAACLQRLGPDLVVATGLVLSDYPDRFGILASSKDQDWLVLTPRFSQHFSGTGDAFSALFLGHYLKTRDVRTALERSTTAIFSLIEATADRNDQELSIVAAQDEMLAPDVRFRALKLE